MERGQNYGITVLYPKQNSTISAENEGDMIFECVHTYKQLHIRKANRRYQPGRHSWSGRRSVHNMDTCQGPAYVAARPFAPGHAKYQNHDLWV